MAGYIRQDTGNSISNGNVIDATYLDAEFEGLVTAFNVTTGHNHDGTVGEGSPILVVGPVQDIVASATALTPKTTNVYDLGTSSLKWKNVYLSGSLLPALFVASNSGTSSAPEYTWSGDLDTGLYSSADDTIDITVGGTRLITISAAEVRVRNNTATIFEGELTAEEFHVEADDAADPGYNWQGDGDTGMYRPAADQVGFATGGVSRLTITATAITANAIPFVGNLTGNVTGNVTGAVTGNASTATALATARTIAIDTGVTGTATSFNGSANISITATSVNADYILAGTVAAARLPAVGATGANAWFGTYSVNVLGEAGVGALAFLRYVSSQDLPIAYGGTVSGSLLRYSNSNGTSSGTPAGTWKCLGRLVNEDDATLFVRTA